MEKTVTQIFLQMHKRLWFHLNNRTSDEEKTAKKWTAVLSNILNTPTWRFANPRIPQMQTSWKTQKKRSFLSNWTCSMYIMQHFPCPTSPASCFDSCFCPQGVNFTLQLPPTCPSPHSESPGPPSVPTTPLKHNDGSAFVVLIEWRKFNYKLLHSPSPQHCFLWPPCVPPAPAGNNYWTGSVDRCEIMVTRAGVLSLFTNPPMCTARWVRDSPCAKFGLKLVCHGSFCSPILAFLESRLSRRIFSSAPPSREMWWR